MSNQETDVRSFFDSRATRWGRGYTAGGNMRPRVARFCNALAQRAPAGARVLDFGCGTGHVARAIAERGYRVTGADVSAEMLGAARNEPTSQELTWVQLRAGAELPFADRSMDVIVSSSVLEYVPNPERTFSEFARILVDGGWLIVTVPDPEHRSRRFEEVVRRGMRIPGAKALLTRTPLQAYVRYLGLSVNRFPLSQWQGIIESCGFSVKATERDNALAMVEACRERRS